MVYGVKAADRTSTIRQTKVFQQWSVGQSLCSGCCQIGCSVGEKQMIRHNSFFFFFCEIEFCFVISWVTRACIHVLGNVPVVRDMLM